MNMTRSERERADEIRAALGHMDQKKQPLAYSTRKSELAELEERAAARAVSPEEIVERHNAATKALGISARMSFDKGWFTTDTSLPGWPSKERQAEALRGAIRREEQLERKREENLRAQARGKRVLLPAMHVNGTSQEELLRQVQEAASAVNGAIDALRRAAPHGRDYYTIPGYAENEAIGIATKEHRGRLAMLETVQAELRELGEHIGGSR